MADTKTKDAKTTAAKPAPAPQTKATLKYLRTSAYKVREVLDLVRGLDVDDARHVLQFSERGPSHEVLKVLTSAVANAGQTRGHGTRTGRRQQPRRRRQRRSRRRGARRREGGPLRKPGP